MEKAFTPISSGDFANPDNDGEGKLSFSDCSLLRNIVDGLGSSLVLEDCFTPIWQVVFSELAETWKDGSGKFTTKNKWDKNKIYQIKEKWWNRTFTTF